MNVSQAVFAGYSNVSVKTVQTWEQGTGNGEAIGCCSQTTFAGQKEAGDPD